MYIISKLLLWRLLVEKNQSNPTPWRLSSHGEVGLEALWNRKRYLKQLTQGWVEILMTSKWSAWWLMGFNALTMIETLGLQ